MPLNPGEEHVLSSDLEDVLGRSEADLRALRGGRILITGGTGFVGSWLLESIAWANRRAGLKIAVVVAVRDPGAIAARAPRLRAEPAFRFVTCDVARGRLPAGPFDAIVHAATPTGAATSQAERSALLETIAGGTRRVLEHAQASGKIPFLLTSSGAVYGRQPPDLPLIDETYSGAPDPVDPANAYHEGKRMAELLCALHARPEGLQPKIARLFAFVGPYLPLDRHFAVGNFIADALGGRPIRVAGDGTPLRSYLYASDMTTWLWRILVRGETLRPYNVGSDEPLDIATLARTVARVLSPGATVKIAGRPEPGRLPERYVPATHRARTELGLDRTVALESAIARTAAWHRAAPASVRLDVRQ
jgi:dTDP-glucose 4,6-dehydratase